MKAITGGWQMQIIGGVMHINTVEGSVLRISGLPMDLHMDVSDVEGIVIESMVGT